jgi:hypothetical protein
MRWASFADALWYVDSMASAAKLSFEAYCRQDFIGADYGLCDCATGAPLPDYWAAVLWSRLVGAAVLNASVPATAPVPHPAAAATAAAAALQLQAGLAGAGAGAGAGAAGGGAGISGASLRLYAHCTPPGAAAPAGSVTAIILNLGPAAATVDVTVSAAAGHEPDGGPGGGFRSFSTDVTAFQLTSLAAPGLTPATGLNGTGAVLNGRPLALHAGGAVPDLLAEGVRRGTSLGLSLPPASISFFVLRDVGVVACLQAQPGA